MALKGFVQNLIRRDHHVGRQGGFNDDVLTHIPNQFLNPLDHHVCNVMFRPGTKMSGMFSRLNTVDVDITALDVTFPLHGQQYNACPLLRQFGVSGW